MRVSKNPEVRKQEMIDTAMRLFASKGYEATSMADIAKEMQVVPGLCYRYFRSKEELYHAAVSLYAKECAAPMIEIFKRPYDSLEEVGKQVAIEFCRRDGTERYHEFFHGEGNQMFHRELEVHMIQEILPYVEDVLKMLKEKGKIHVVDARATAEFLLHGQMPIINDDTRTPEEKMEVLLPLCEKVLL